MFKQRKRRSPQDDNMVKRRNYLDSSGSDDDDADIEEDDTTSHTHRRTHQGGGTLSSHRKRNTKDSDKSKKEFHVRIDHTGKVRRRSHVDEESSENSPPEDSDDDESTGGVATKKGDDLALIPESRKIKERSSRIPGRKLQGDVGYLTSLQQMTLKKFIKEAVFPRAKYWKGEALKTKVMKKVYAELGIDEDEAVLYKGRLLKEIGEIITIKRNNVIHTAISKVVKAYIRENECVPSMNDIRATFRVKEVEECDENEMQSCLWFATTGLAAVCSDWRKEMNKKIERSLTDTVTPTDEAFLMRTVEIYGEHWAAEVNDEKTKQKRNKARIKEDNTTGNDNEYMALYKHFTACRSGDLVHTWDAKIKQVVMEKFGFDTSEKKAAGKRVEQETPNDFDL